MTFLNELVKIREDYMRAKNAEYKKVEDEVIQAGFKGIDPEKLKAQMIEKVKGDMKEGRVEITYDFSIDKLFKDNYEKEGPPALELWHSIGNGECICSRLFRERSDNYKEWQNYFQNKSIQPILTRLKQIFPDALLQFDFRCYQNAEYSCVIYISYKLPPVKL